ncbi:fatty acid desaturase [Pseudomonas aeruginosa]|nr:fatty acid desaturase [Pseudomonas aeruginosa]
MFSVGETVKGRHRGLVGAGVPGQERPATRHRGEGAGVEVGRRPAALQGAVPRSRRARQGRFYNCPTGWTCEIVNSQKLKAYRLQDSYTNFRTGTGPALDAAISAAFRRGEPVLFLLLVADSVDGPFQAGATGRAAVQREGLGHPVRSEEPRPHRFPLVAGEDHHWRSRDFHDKAPALVELFRKVEIPLPLFNELLADMAQNHREVGEVRAQFLRQHREIWSHWVPAESRRAPRYLPEVSLASLHGALPERASAHLVRRLQDTFQARSGMADRLLIACLYGGWALLASQYRHWGWPVLAGLVPFASLYMSLQHELIHGHPTRWPRFNAVLGYLPLAVWYPYPLYRDSHLRHHLDEQLTYPGLDPESLRRVCPNGRAWAPGGGAGSAWTRPCSVAPPRPAAGPGGDGAPGGFAVAPGEGAASAPVGPACRAAGRVAGRALALGGHPALVVPAGGGLSGPRPEHAALFLRAPSGPRAGAAQRAGRGGVAWRLLFLNNNLHLVHHDLPGLPWYLLPRVYSASRRAYRRRSGDFHLPGYGRLWRRHGWRPVDAPVHPEH